MRWTHQQLYFWRKRFVVFCTALAPETPPDVLFQPDYILNKYHKSSNLLNSTVTKAFRLFHNMFVLLQKNIALNGLCAFQNRLGTFSVSLFLSYQIILCCKKNWLVLFKRKSSPRSKKPGYLPDHKLIRFNIKGILV